MKKVFIICLLALLSWGPVIILISLVTQFELTALNKSIRPSIKWLYTDPSNTRDNEKTFKDSVFTILKEDNRTRERVMPMDLKSEPAEYLADWDDPSFKKILFWNDMYGKPHFTFGLGREPFLRAGCPFNRCVTTSNRSLYSLLEIDALIWHFRSNNRELPKLSFRSPHTRYVFWMQESPMHLFGDLQSYNGIFNWTFTYRLDSDFPSPAGLRMVRTEVERNTILTIEATQQKGKLIAWFVSNCKSASGRESLVRSLQQYLPVDIYGDCGPYECKRSEQARCYEMLERDYKFYLSFENSLCKDYITEKFFHLLQNNVLPIVWGSGNYSLQAPKHSYISASDFETVQELAEYIGYLDKNITAYMEYFAWKKDYQLLTGWAATVRPWCDLCERLHKDKSVKIYEDLNMWFNTDAHCQLPTSPVTSRFVHGLKPLQDVSE